MKQDITYKTGKEEYLSLAISLVMVTIVEIFAFELVLAFLISDPLIKWPLLALLLGLHLYFIWFILGPIRKKHYLSATHLLLNYGFNFKAEIPLETIVSAQSASEKIEMMKTLRSPFDETRAMLLMAMSPKGQVLLQLDREYPFRIGRKTVNASSILMSVDRPAEFLQMLSPALNKTA